MFDASNSELARRRLDDGLAACGLGLDERARGTLIHYLELLERWNRTYNLTAIRDIGEMVTRHVLDCLSIVPFLRGRRLLDLGTGAGLPGIVLAIADPALECVVLDANAKKVRFCRQVKAELTLANVEVAHCRAEHHQPERPFPLIVCRALLTLGAFHQLARPLLLAPGRLIHMKGRYPSAELEVLAAADAHVRVEPVRVPGLGASRHVVVIDVARPGA